MLLCIDIGNTHTHAARIPPGGRGPGSPIEEFPTASLGDEPHGLAHRLQAWHAAQPIEAVAFCSVVPAAVEPLRRAVAAAGLPAWQLTAAADLGVAINYPQPAEIGHDRLANAAGAAALGHVPAVVIDLGTAVTFDIVTRRGGYEGGIIAPGPALMTRYLHEKTAQLPLVEDLDRPVDSVIGKSTADAMRIGAVVGFTGLLQTCLDRVLAELAAAGESDVTVIACGGAFALAAGRLRESVVNLPDLTLRGLAASWVRSTASRAKD